MISKQVKIKLLLGPGKLDHQRANTFVDDVKAGVWMLTTEDFHDVEFPIPKKLFKQSGNPRVGAGIS